jgi:hypothetical protein
VDWRQYAAVMQREAVTVMPSCSVVIFIPLTVVKSLSYGRFKGTHFGMAKQRGPFEKFVDSPYYSKSELCGGAVIVSGLSLEVPPLASDALFTTLHPLLKRVNGVTGESTNLSNGPRSCSAILKTVLLKRPQLKFERQLEG